MSFFASKSRFKQELTCEMFVQKIQLSGGDINEISSAGKLPHDFFAE